MQSLVRAIANRKGFFLEATLKPYEMVKEELCVVDGLVLRADRVVIPLKLRKRAIEIAHRSHQGIVKTKRLLRETLWFPGMDRIVEETIAECLACQAATHG